MPYGVSEHKSHEKLIRAVRGFMCFVANNIKRWQGQVSLFWQQHFVNNVDHAVRLIHVGDGDFGRAAAVIGDHDI